MKRLEIPEKLMGALKHMCVPLVPDGTVWLGSDFVGTQMHSHMVKKLAANAARRRSISEVYGKAKKGRYVAPSDLGYELPTAGHPELVFTGRSNVGKSTLLGTLLGNVKLCRRSKTPGCTTTINFFETGGPSGGYFVDLPGFGYAHQTKDLQEGWKEHMLAYLTGRDKFVLRHASLLVDSRRSGHEKDYEALYTFSQLGISHGVVLVKADLAKPHEIADSLYETYRLIQQTLRQGNSCLPIVHVVSSKKNFGIDQLRDHLGELVYDSNDTLYKVNKASAPKTHTIPTS